MTEKRGAARGTLAPWALAALLLAPFAEASLPHTVETDAAALRVASLAEPSRLAPLAASDDVERFTLFARDGLAPEPAPLALASRVREERFSLHLGADAFAVDSLRGPPPLGEDLCLGDDECLAGTRIGGLEPSGPFFTKGQPRLTLGLQWACSVSSCGLADGKPLDPWGLAVKVAPGTYDYREQGEAVKEDARYLGWLASSPDSVLTDYNQRREFLTTAGELAGHAAGWVFNRPEWDVLGMMSAVKVPSAVGRAGKVLRAGEEALEAAVRLERAEEAGSTLARTRGGAEPVRIGQAGEAVGSELTGLPKNTKRIPSASGKREYRVPDHMTVDEHYLAEDKAVKKQHLSSQLLDDKAHVLRDDMPGRVDVNIDEGARISLPLLREHLNPGSPIKLRPVPLVKCH